MVQLTVAPFPWWFPVTASHSGPDLTRRLEACRWPRGAGFSFSVSEERVVAVSPGSEAHPLPGCQASVFPRPRRADFCCGASAEGPRAFLFQLLQEPHLWHVHRAGLRDRWHGWRFARCVHRREAEDRGPASPGVWRGRARWVWPPSSGRTKEAAPTTLGPSPPGSWEPRWVPASASKARTALVSRDALLPPPCPLCPFSFSCWKTFKPTPKLKELYRELLVVWPVVNVVLYLFSLSAYKLKFVVVEPFESKLQSPLFGGLVFNTFTVA